MNLSHSQQKIIHNKNRTENVKTKYILMSATIVTWGLTTYSPLIAERISRECSNSLVSDSIVLAGLGKEQLLKASLLLLLPT